jgi:hypothetical protein
MTSMRTVAKTAGSNSALEQTATPSRSWHRRQEVGSKGLARQERASPPLLTASVRPRLRSRGTLSSALLGMGFAVTFLWAARASFAESPSPTPPGDFLLSDVSLTVEFLYDRGMRLNDPNPPVIKDKIVLSGRGHLLREVTRMKSGASVDSCWVSPDTVAAYLIRLVGTDFLRSSQSYTYRDEIWMSGGNGHISRTAHKCGDLATVKLLIGDYQKLVVFAPRYAPVALLTYCERLRTRFLSEADRGGPPCSE